MAGWTCSTIALAIALVLFGASTSNFGKVLFQIQAVGLDGEEHFFKKPWFEVMCMFVAMSICMLFHLIAKIRTAYKSKYTPVISVNASSNDVVIRKPENAYSWKVFFYIAAPAVFDLVATALAAIGLLFTTASVFQMMRGAMLVFSAILSVVFLKRKLYANHYLGILLCCCALVAVGLSSLFNQSGSQDGGQQIIGVLLIAGAQFVQASQLVAEEALLKSMSAPPMLIVGMEGVWGAVIMLAMIAPICWAIPGEDFGSYEHFGDSVEMMHNSTLISGIVVAYIFALFAYNFSGIMVTQNLSALHRSVIETLRTLAVWGIGLFLHYEVDESIGEGWDNWSYLQLVAFFVLVLGTMIYNEIVRVPCLRYPQHDIIIGEGGEDKLLGGNGKDEYRIAPAHVEGASAYSTPLTSPAITPIQSPFISPYLSARKGSPATKGGARYSPLAA